MRHGGKYPTKKNNKIQNNDIIMNTIKQLYNRHTLYTHANIGCELMQIHNKNILLKQQCNQNNSKMMSNKNWFKQL